MESGAKGCEVVISGKLRAARAKSMKFTDGFMIQLVISNTRKHGFTPMLILYLSTALVSLLVTM